MYSTNTANNFFVPHTVLEDVKFIKQSPATQMLYIHYCKLANRFSDEEGWFWRSMEQLVRDTGFSKRTIISANKKLSENEFVDIKNTFYEHSKKKTYNSYKLNGFRFRSGEKNST